jgi:hypothetical protein
LPHWKPGSARRSLLVQYQRDEIIQVARVVEQKLEALIAEVTTEGRT